MEYAILDSSKSKIKKIVKYDILPPYRKGYLLPVKSEIVPNYDLNTQHIQEGKLIIYDDYVLRTWNIINKSSEELNIEETRNKSAQKIEQIKKSNVWNKIKNEQDLTPEEIQKCIHFLFYLIQNDYLI